MGLRKETVCLQLPNHTWLYPEGPYTIAMYFPPPNNCSRVCCPIVTEGGGPGSRKGKAWDSQHHETALSSLDRCGHVIRGLLETQCLPLKVADRAENYNLQSQVLLNRGACHVPHHSGRPGLELEEGPGSCSSPAPRALQDQ